MAYATDTLDDITTLEDHQIDMLYNTARLIYENSGKYTDFLAQFLNHSNSGQIKTEHILNALLTDYFNACNKGGQDKINELTVLEELYGKLNDVMKMKSNDRVNYIAHRNDDLITVLQGAEGLKKEDQNIYSVACDLVCRTVFVRLTE